MVPEGMIALPSRGVGSRDRVATPGPVAAGCCLRAIAIVATPAWLRGTALLGLAIRRFQQRGSLSITVALRGPIFGFA